MTAFTHAVDVRRTDRRRASVLLRPFYAFPAAIYASFYAGIGWVAAGLAWLWILVTGRYPAQLYTFNEHVVRMLVRFYSFLLIAHDEPPPLHGDPDPAYPCRVEVPPPRATYDRKAIAMRPIYAVPVVGQALLSYAIGVFCAVVGAFVVAFTGKLPDAFVAPLREAVADMTHAFAYLALMIDEPPALPPGEAPAPALGG